MIIVNVDEFIFLTIVNAFIYILNLKFLVCLRKK